MKMKNRYSKREEDHVSQGHRDYFPWRFSNSGARFDRGLIKVVGSIVICILIIHLTGCMMLIAEAVTSVWPTFEETQKQWPTIPNNRGRVLVYWPAQSTGSVIVHGSLLESVNVLVDNNHKIQLTSGTFVFADMAPGNIDIKLVKPKLFSSELAPLTELKLSLAAGATTYIRINFTPKIMQAANFNLSVVEPAEALQELQQTHHNYKNPRPFDDPKSIRGASLGGG